MPNIPLDILIVALTIARWLLRNVIRITVVIALLLIVALFAGASVESLHPHSHFAHFMHTWGGPHILQALFWIAGVPVLLVLLIAQIAGGSLLKDGNDGFIKQIPGSPLQFPQDINGEWRVESRLRR